MDQRGNWFLWSDEHSAAEVEHRELTEEYNFYQAVASGDVEAVRRNCEQSRFTQTDGVGILSRDPVVNLKYHFVITTALVTRLCRQHGMELEQGFRLSDFYIQQLDNIKTEQGVQTLHSRMVMDFTRKMQAILRRDTASKHVNACKDYIFAHLDQRITVAELADELEVSSSYLSRTFKTTTGISISLYIRDQKIEAAKNLLKFSDSSLGDIAHRLAFASQSHFIQAFRDATGMTPKKYRDENYQVLLEVKHT